MPIEKQNFVNYKLEEEREQQKGKTFGVWLTNEELVSLEALGRFYHQEKLSSVIKHCVELEFAKLAGRDERVVLRDILFNNTRKNQRLGIVEVKPKFRIS
jgi:hypothetical protein